MRGIAAVSGGTPQAYSGASPYSTPAAKMSNLFSQIDAASSGSISQAQFTQAFNTKNPPRVFQKQGADSIFSQLDTSGTGNVSRSEFVSGMSSLMRTLRGGASSAGAAESPASTINSTLSALNQLDVLA